MRVDDVIDILQTGEGVSYDGEAVDELTHALQCAMQASWDGGGDELVAAALLHDIGRAPQVKTQFTGATHEVAGAAFCRSLFGERVAWLVGAHVSAKRLLVTVEPGYAGRLSAASLKSLVEQGGTFTAEEARNFQVHPWSADAVRLRRWDDAAKKADEPVPELTDLAAVLSRVVAAHR